jgi:MFS family permease
VSAPSGRGLSRDARLILAVQGLRAFVYGLGSVVIGVSLERSDLGRVAVGAVLAALVAGTAAATFAAGRYGDRIGRRRVYRTLLAVMGVAGGVFALTDSLPLLLIVAATGTVSTEVIESGPFSSLEQAMLPAAAGRTSIVRLFGTYSSVAALAGSVGALAAAAGNGTQLLLLSYPVAAAAGLVASIGLGETLEVAGARERRSPLHRSRSQVRRLAALFALDSLGGGFVVQAFIAYWLSARFDADPQLIAVSFFVIGLLQTLSFQLAVRLAARAGLLRTMVVTHLVSNVALVSVAFAPSLEVALVLLFARFALSQMDVPTRQAYVVALVDPDERTAASAYTSTARQLTRPAGPLLGGVVSSIGLGAPFIVGGVVKTTYDVLLYALFRSAPVMEDAAPP